MRTRTDAPLGSRWDGKILGNAKLMLVDLRYKAGQMVVEYNWSIRDTAAQLGMSVGWVHKWAKIFRARKRINEKNHKVTRNVFRSISNRPRSCGCPVRDSIRTQVRRIRSKYPFLGSAKIRRMLSLEVSPTTIDRVIRECGLGGEYRSRDRNKTYGSFQRPNSLDMVQIDYKKWGERIYSIWVLDDCSRFILGHRVDAETSADNVIELLESTFSFWGMWPKQILSDHGTEFFSMIGGKGASKLDRWCESRGIEHITGRVRHPQTQGKIERSHGSAKVEHEAFGCMDSLSDARETISSWVEFYNTERPHQAIDYRTPLEHFLARLDLDNMRSFMEV